MHSRTASLLKTTLASTVIAMSLVGCQRHDATPADTSTHSHDHDHGHHHSKPRFGGQLEEIGHVHKPDGVTFYLAEILPEKDSTIRIHISAETENGETKVATIENATVEAYVTDPEEESMFSEEIVFTLRKEDGDIAETLLCADIPADLLKKNRLALVVPKIVLGGERLSFSLTVERDPPQSTSPDAAHPPREPETGATPDEKSPIDTTCPPQLDPGGQDDAPLGATETSS